MAIKKVTDLLIILPITLMIAYFSAIYLWYFILFPSYLVDPDHLMENKPVWEMKERYFGEEYEKERAKALISLNYQMFWRGQTSLFVVQDSDGAGDCRLAIYSSIAADRGISSEIAKGDWVITISNLILWHDSSRHMGICADALEDTPVEISVGSKDYVLDETGESIRAFEEETDLDAEGYLDMVRLIREEYRTDLNTLIEMDYQRVRSGIIKRVCNLSVIWGIWLIFCALVLKWDKIYALYSKRYEKKLDGYMEDFEEEQGE